MGPSKATSTDQKPGVSKNTPVNVPKNKKGEDLDGNDAGVDYRATDITRQSNRVNELPSEKPVKGFAGDDRTNLREDFKRKFGDKDGPAKYYVDYSEKDCSVEDCSDEEEGDLT